MVIHKILNNNLILSRDGQGHEVIVKVAVCYNGNFAHSMDRDMKLL